MNRTRTSPKSTTRRIASLAIVSLAFVGLACLCPSSAKASTIFGYMGEDGTLYVSDRKLNKNYKVLYKSNERRVSRSSPGSSVAVSANSGRRASKQEMEKIKSWVTYYSLCYRLDPKLVHAVITTESNYCITAVSSKGAQGLMQIMPETGRGLGLSKPFDPEDNIKAGVKYLREMVDRFQNTRLALAAYNAGPGAVEQYGGIPPYDETVRYVEKVMGSYERLKTDADM